MKALLSIVFLFVGNAFAITSSNNCVVAPDFSLRDQTGEMKSLQRIRSTNPDKVFFISFFQTTCAPCIEEIRDLIALRSSNDLARLVLVDSKEGRDETFKFMQKFNFTADFILNDPNGRLDRLFAIDAVPRLIVVDVNSHILGDFSGTQLFELRKNNQFHKKMNEIINFKKCR